MSAEIKEETTGEGESFAEMIAYAKERCGDLRELFRFFEGLSLGFVDNPEARAEVLLAARRIALAGAAIKGRLRMIAQLEAQREAPERSLGPEPDLLFGERETLEAFAKIVRRCHAKAAGGIVSDYDIRTALQKLAFERVDPLGRFAETLARAFDVGVHYLRGGL